MLMSCTAQLLYLLHLKVHPSKEITSHSTFSPLEKSSTFSPVGVGGGRDGGGGSSK